jgi:hypothetical protein
MAKVYLVVSGDGSDGSPDSTEGIFSTREKANEFIDSVRGRNTEEWDIEAWELE